MALFKPFKGNRASLRTQPLHEGYAYFCVDDGSFHIDYVDDNGDLQRKQLNAKDAKTLTGMSLAEIQQSIEYNDLIDRPFGDFYSIKRTGNETVTVVGKYTTFTLISNSILEYEELSGVALYSGASGSFPSINRFSDYVYGNYTGILAVTQAGATYSQISNNPFPEVGVYLGAEVEYAVLQVKKIPEKYIPSKYTTTESVQAQIDEATVNFASKDYVDSKQVQSDWTVNDETNPAYVQNRPFYTSDPIETSILDEVTFAKSGMSEYDKILYQSISLNRGLDEGVIYTVVINDDSYELVPKNHNGILYFGNYNIENSYIESSGESYCITESYFDVYNDENVEDSYTIKITAMLTEDIQIDKKYLKNKPGEILPVGETRSIYLNSTEGNVNVVIEDYAEIFNAPSNVASGYASHAEGEYTIATGDTSHAEGNGTEATGYGAHAEGSGSRATAAASHAEGNSTTASGHYSHAEGSGTEASGRISHAEGDGSEATEWASHAEGCMTIAAGEKQHVQGQYNIADAQSKYAHIVGNGTNYNRRSNAHTLDWNGTAWFAGDVKVGGAGQDDAAAKTLATTEYVRSFLPKSTTVTISATKWTGTANPWSQVVTVNGATENSKLDLCPTAMQIVALQDAGVSLMLQNDSGVVTAWAIGNKPTTDYTINVLLTEVQTV